MSRSSRIDCNASGALGSSFTVPDGPVAPAGRIRAQSIAVRRVANLYQLMRAYGSNGTLMRQMGHLVSYLHVMNTGMFLLRDGGSGLCDSPCMAIINF